MSYDRIEGDDGERIRERPAQSKCARAQLNLWLVELDRHVTARFLNDDLGRFVGPGGRIMVIGFGERPSRSRALPEAHRRIQDRF